MSDLVCVLTTIQEPTIAVLRLAAAVKASGGRLVVIGDRKGPRNFELPDAEFYPLAVQRELPFRTAGLVPEAHYGRKNIGYLLAMSSAARCIYETDDDNEPNEEWRPRRIMTEAEPVRPRPWMNVYRAFCQGNIWPRGFPLNLANDPSCGSHDSPATCVTVRAPIQQGLADLSPDVDAVWRLLQEEEVTFARRPSLHLPPYTWCPFNSQTTWWWPEAYPLLYLPCFCSFRMTDIWRSFVAQRCLWELGLGIVFHGPEVRQQRNAHDLMRDFKDEVPGYLQNAAIAELLSNLSLASGVEKIGDNLLSCYEALIAAGILPEKERPLVQAWVSDVNDLQGRPSARAA